MIDSSPFEHIKPRRESSDTVAVELALPFPKLNQLVKLAICTGVVLPICIGCTGAALLFSGIKIGFAFVILAMAFFTGTVTLSFFAAIMLPVALKPNQLRLSGTSIEVKEQGRTIDIPWQELVSIVAPSKAQETTLFSRQKEGIVVNTTKGTFRIFSHRSREVCDYIEQLIATYAAENEIAFKVESNPELEAVKELPMPKTHEYRFKGPLLTLAVASFFGLLLYFEASTAWVDQNWNVGEGTITKIQDHQIGRREGKLVEYEYEFEGQTHSGHYFINNKSPDPNLPIPMLGNILELRISPNNPAENQIRRKPDFAAMIVTLFFITACIVGAIWFFKSSTGKNHAATNAFDKSAQQD